MLVQIQSVTPSSNQTGPERRRGRSEKEEGGLMQEEIGRCDLNRRGVSEGRVERR